MTSHTPDHSIVRLTIENFQSHAHTTIEPAPAGELTVLTGPNDAGKTAVIRALRWLWFNVPYGTDFIRVGCTFARVTVEMASGWTVIRERTKSRNRYITIDPAAGRQEYEGFGSEVPLEVQEALGIRPVSIGDVSFRLNLAEQLDGPFLGSSISAGARAKVLGKLAGTEAVDVASKTLGTDLYRRGQEEKGLAERLDGLQQQIEEYAWVPDLGERIERLEELLAAIKAAQKRLNELQTVRARLTELTARIDKGWAYLQRFDGLEQAEDTLAWLKRDARRLTELQRQHEQLAGLDRRIGELTSYIERFRGLVPAIAILVTLELDYVWLEMARRSNGRYKEATQLAAVLRTKLERLAGADRAAELLTTLQSACERWTVLDRSRTRLAATDKEHAWLSAGLATLADIDKAPDLLARIGESIAQRARLATVGQQLTGLTQRFTAVQDTCRRLQGADEALVELASVEDTRARLTALRQAWGKVSRLRQAEQATKGALELHTSTLLRAQRQYKQALEQAGLCPTCGATTEQYRLEEVV